MSNMLLQWEQHVRVPAPIYTEDLRNHHPTPVSGSSVDTGREVRDIRSSRGEQQFFVTGFCSPTIKMRDKVTLHREG